MKITIKQCCKTMGQLISEGVVKITNFNDSKILTILAKNGNILTINYCPCCGKKIEIN